MSLWKYLGEFLMFRWLFGHHKSCSGNCDSDAPTSADINRHEETIYRPPHRPANRCSNNDCLYSNHRYESYEPDRTVDEDFLDDLDHFDDF